MENRDCRCEGGAIRIIFMGTPAFALPSLERLVADGHEIPLIVTQPDRPAGRGRRLRPPAVAEFARARGLRVYQTDSLRRSEARAPLEATPVEAIVVAAFGLYLPSEVLALPLRGALNVHPSLLPRHRGASPIQATILAGDEVTGSTVIEVTARMDAGPIVGQHSTPIGPVDDALTLETRLANIGAALLSEVLEPWRSGSITPVEQDESLATYSSRITRQDAHLQWHEPALTLWRKVRAYRGWPEAYAHWLGRTLKVLQAEPIPEKAGPEAGVVQPGGAHRLTPGQIFVWSKEDGAAWPAVRCGEGALLLRRLVIEGKRPASGEDFLRGYPTLVGAVLD